MSVAECDRGGHADRLVKGGEANRVRCWMLASRVGERAVRVYGRRNEHRSRARVRIWSSGRYKLAARRASHPLNGDNGALFATADMGVARELRRSSIVVDAHHVSEVLKEVRSALKRVGDAVASRLEPVYAPLVQALRRGDVDCDRRPKHSDRKHSDDPPLHEPHAHASLIDAFGRSVEPCDGPPSSDTWAA